LLKPTLVFFPSEPGYNLTARSSSRDIGVFSFDQMPVRTACGPTAARPRMAPSYRPAGGYDDPSGEGNGEELSVFVNVDVRPKGGLGRTVKAYERS
jgi:hypothetical protein